MKVALVQFDIGEGIKDKNLSRMSALLDQAKDADLIVLPELWNIGYFSFDRYLSEAEGDDGQTISLVRKKASDLNAHILGGSVIERDGDHLYNTAYFVSPDGKILSKYRKANLFGINSKEKELLSPGRDAPVVKMLLGSIGFAICYDLRFPDHFFKMTSDGADAVVVSSAWPRSRVDHWMLLNRARAVENQMFVIACGAVGTNHGNELAGHSMVVDPWGEVVAEAGLEECIVRAEIDLGDVRKVREKWPFLKDRIKD